ncbi:hypothetical protein T4E_1833 [Trichinella pseudospiralis]|uniref:Uncharacterized protein n=1 Tax=Trichinella pseudospiralis TaxID=6337 RepID=A0A0V0XGC8_TRIPS|nr:hypothetical protein T4E_7225 [Trichinella pseudospiralis]KRX87049.1 hypothetical protein T4E_1833 [Trichinella pseudospiralis]
MLPITDLISARLTSNPSAWPIVVKSVGIHLRQLLHQVNQLKKLRALLRKFCKALSPFTTAIKSCLAVASIVQME